MAEFCEFTLKTIKTSGGERVFVNTASSLRFACGSRVLLAKDLRRGEPSNTVKTGKNLWVSNCSIPAGMSELPPAELTTPATSTNALELKGKLWFPHGRVR